MGVPTTGRAKAFWLLSVLALVCWLPSSKPPVDAQAVISNPNPDPVLWSGHGVPPGSTGDSGDFWINQDAPMAIYGPKVAPSTWPGPTSMIGPAGSTGATGAAGPSIVGSPAARTLSFATAYQATNTAKPAVITINLSSVATISLAGGTTNTAAVYIGSTNAVASGTGTLACPFTNSNTGALTIGLNLSTTATTTCTLALPAGWYFSVLQSAGTVTIVSAQDQQVG